MKNISVVINTKNSAKTLETTLKSVSWCDDIVITDMHSTDDTKKIAKKYTDNIYDFKDVGFVEPARNFAISKAKNDWILVLDADEEISDTLANTLKGLTNKNVDVFDIPRKNIVFDQWLQHAGWWPDYQRRFFKKGAISWSDKIHSIPTVKGKIEKLDPKESQAIIHHNYQSIEQYIDRLNRYTTIEAKQNKDQIVDSAKILSSGFSELFRRYFKEKGFQDNVHGLSVTLLQMFYQITTQLKIWQESKFKAGDNSIVDVFPKITRQMNYWYADFRERTEKNIFRKIYWRIRKHFSV